MSHWLKTTAAGIFALTYACAANAQIVLYEDDNFNGRSYRSSYSVSNLDGSGFNDKASSVTVRRGTWQFCDNAYFRGRCVTLGPGEYPSLRSMGINNKVSSARELGWTPDGAGGWNGNNSYNSYNSDAGYNNRYPPSNSWGSGNWGSGARAILFSSYNLTGEAFTINPSGIGNLNNTGFNDKARSLRVESGYWIFCTDAYYQGDCLTYSPGDYLTLAGGQSQSISSGRRISENYPYRSNPNWSGGR